MIKPTIFLCTLGLWLTTISYAQRQPLYSQFTFNKYLFNPAVAGSDNTTMIRASGYEQWLGFKGAPKFHTLSFDTRIFMDSKKPRRNVKKKFKFIKPGSVGAGAVIFNEKYGPLSYTGILATYAYHIKLGSRQLSFGLSPMISNLNLSASDVVLPDEDFDDLLSGNKTSRWIMDFDFGIYFQDKNYFAGYSIHNMSAAALQWGGSGDYNFQYYRQHYLMAGYKYLVNQDITLEPSVLVKIPEGAKSLVDISVRTTIKRDYWCGLAYKSSNILSVFGGLQLDRYFFSYAFDYPMGSVRKYSYGSHEILLGIQLGETTKRYRWLNTY